MSVSLVMLLITTLMASSADAVVKTYYVQEDGTCGNSYGTSGNVWKPAAEGGSGSCTQRSRIGGRWQSNTIRNYLIGYTSPYSTETSITGSTSGVSSNINFRESESRGSFTGRVRFVEVNATGDTILANQSSELTINVLQNSWRYINDLSSLNITISAGNRLGLIVSVSNTNDVNANTYFGNNGGGQQNETWFTVDEVSTNTPPSLIINLPDGTETPITVGNNYSIDYDLEDTEDDVTVTFYYDTDTDPAVKTAIAGACATAGEGAGATCTWNTAGVPAGAYYIYGVTSDGTNPQVAAYSSGQVTINPVVNSTTAGTATVQRGNAVIDVSAPYTDDGDNDNTLLIEWGLNGVDFSLGAETLTHDDSPYNYQIDGLTNGVSYQVRVTYQDDPDGVNGTAVQVFSDIVPVDFNPLIHSSISTGSSKWGGDWGLEGGKYGEFTCNTCHMKGSSNIKRIKEKISFPDGSTMPNGLLNSVVVLSNTNSGSADFGDDSDGRNTTASNRICEVCHSITNYHRSATFNTPTLTHNNKSDCIDCHQHKQGFKPVGNCDACHDVNSSHPTAPKVVDVSGSTLNGEAYGTHLKATLGDDLSSVDWAEQCGQCHEMHNGSVFIQNNPAVGINYTDHGGIYLGGPTTNAMINTKTTEAEICWGCHYAQEVSEFNAMRDYGYNVIGLEGSAGGWTASLGFDLIGNSVPTRKTNSMHTANDIDVEEPAPATPGVGLNATVRSSSVSNNLDWSSNPYGAVRKEDPDTVFEDISAIRCSYCHDVHGTANYTGVIADADDPDGHPYIRGTFLINPYPDERPPETGDTFPGNVFPGMMRNGSVTQAFPAGFNVPRLYSDSVGSATVGGFFIDQNSGYPTYNTTLGRYYTASETSGLCLLCHATGEVGDGAKVDNMDYYTDRNLWNGVNGNGHSNSTLSGTGLNASNLFDARRQDITVGSTDFWMHGQNIPTGPSSNGRDWGDGGNRNNNMPYGQHFESRERDATNGNLLPARNTGWYGGVPGADEREPADEYSAWYSTGGIGSNGDGNTTRAHSFSCSKCHAPHSSGLPALLITNCLDPEIATWSYDTSDTTVGPGAWVDGTESNHKNRWTFMGNCHRKENSTTSGWNNLAPAQ